MENSPWEALIFRNGNWENVLIPHVKIWECVQIILKEEEYEKEKTCEDNFYTF
jgi:hypothetical protein